MKFSAPKQVTWWMPWSSGCWAFWQPCNHSGFDRVAFWLVVIGFVLLAIATVMEGL